METIELPVMAAALCCQPRTLSRLIHGRFAARSLQKAPVSLALAAQYLKTEQLPLSLFLRAALNGTDEALTPEFAMMVLDKPRSTFFRLLKEGKIPVIVHVGRFSRFSRNQLAALVDA